MGRSTSRRRRPLKRRQRDPRCAYRGRPTSRPARSFITSFSSFSALWMPAAPANPPARQGAGHGGDRVGRGPGIRERQAVAIAQAVRLRDRPIGRTSPWIFGVPLSRRRPRAPPCAAPRRASPCRVEALPLVAVHAARPHRHAGPMFAHEVLHGIDSAVKRFSSWLGAPRRRPRSRRPGRRGAPSSASLLRTISIQHAGRVYGVRLRSSLFPQRPASRCAPRDVENG